LQWASYRNFERENNNLLIRLLDKNNEMLKILRSHEDNSKSSFNTWRKGSDLLPCFPQVQV